MKTTKQVSKAGIRTTEDKDQSGDSNDTNSSENEPELKYFEAFNKPDYSLVPVPENNKLEVWFFKNCWMVLSLIFVCLGLLIYLCQRIPPSPEAQLIYLANFQKPIQSNIEFNLSLYTKFYLPILFVLILESFLIADLSNSASQMFVALEAAGRLQANSHFVYRKRRFFSLLNPVSAGKFSANLVAALQSPWRFSGMLLFVIIVLYFLITYHQVNFLVTLFATKYWPLSLYNLIELTIMPLVIAYWAGLSLWFFTVLSSFVASMTPIFKLNIEPLHPDQTGGMKRLGGLSLNMALMTILPSLAISVWHLSGLFDDVNWRAFREIEFIAISLMLLVSMMAFFWPIWDTHREMVRIGDNYHDATIKKINSLQTEILNALNDPGADQSTLVETLEKKIESIKKIRIFDQKFPVWPFDTSILLKFTVPQVLPVLTLLAGLGESQTNVVQKFFDLISAWLGGG